MKVMLRAHYNLVFTRVLTGSNPLALSYLVVSQMLFWGLWNRALHLNIDIFGVANRRLNYNRGYQFSPKIFFVAFS